MKRKSRKLPWARVSGLFAGCVATLIGICCRLEPETILMRALAAATVVAVFVRLLRALAFITPLRRQTR